MEPPPRKGQYFKILKTLHGEQLSKLQAKNQQECELLDDIKNFTKQRSAIEKSYGEALCKMSANFQNRKIACVPDVRLEDRSEAWNIYSVWRTVLDETEKLGKARLAAVEVFHQRISEDAKQLRHVKLNLQKKLSENLSTCQKELQMQVQELDRTKKLYYDEENVAHDAREKANAAEEKLKRKKGSIFQSISSLQKNSAKFTAKRDMCDEKSSGARNDYLIALAITNAHQRRYYEIDFERTLRTMEHNMFDKVAEYFNLLSRTELLTCSATQSSYSTIRDQSKTITRGYNLRCYMTFYPMLGKSIEYEFLPCKGDKIKKVTAHDEISLETLNADSKRCVEKLLKDCKTIVDAKKKIRKLRSTQKEGSELPHEVESKIDEIRQIIRKCETSKAKLEARLDILKEGGIEVEDYSQQIETDSVETEAEGPPSRTGSPHSLKVETDVKQPTDAVNVPAARKQFSTDSIDTDRETTSAGPKSFDQANWDPLSVDWGDETAAPSELPTDDVAPIAPVTNGAQEGFVYPKYIALYNYEAQNTDELTILENEIIEIVSDGDGDGWIQAKNDRGEIGYIPQNYVEPEDVSSMATTQPTQYTSEYSEETVTGTGYDGQTNGTEPQPQYKQTQEREIEGPVSYGSIDYSYETGDDVTEIEEGMSSYYEPPSEPPPPPPPIIEEEDFAKFSEGELDIPIVTNVDNSGEDYCIALYDYEATCSEELTFEEGQVIRILKRSVHDVDDGWWEGEMDGKIGLFPSIVVEECRNDGEIYSSDEETETSPITTPPPHTPPEVPGFLLPPDRVIVTQPTPDVETVEEAIALREKEKEKPAAQVIGQQQEHYQRQFSSSVDSETVTEREQQYAELVSSPDISHQEEDTTKTEVTEVPPDISVQAPPIITEEEAEEFGVMREDGGADNIEVCAVDQKSKEGLDVTQIVVTAATPVVEDKDKKKMISEESLDDTDTILEDDGQGESEDTEGEAIFLEDDRPPPPPPAPEGGGGSGVEERHEEYETESSSASSLPRQTSMSPPLSSGLQQSGARKDSDNLDSISSQPKSPTPSDGPPDLDPEKLKALEQIKESVA